MNTFDSDTYTVLLDAQQTLTGAKNLISNGAWPQSFAKYVNAVGEAYNVAMPAYKTYHDIAAAGKDVTQAQAALQTDLNQLAVAISNLFANTNSTKSQVQAAAVGR